MKSEFDDYAASYDTALNQGLSLSGEPGVARSGTGAMAGRTAGRLGACGRRACSTTGAALAAQALSCSSGLARRSLSASTPRATASTSRAGHVDPRRFSTMIDLAPSGQFDVAYCNGVFHHVEPGERLDALAYIHRSLAEGGVFGFWENNPWNPGTRLVMRRIPFDRDAKLISPPRANC